MREDGRVEVVYNMLRQDLIPWTHVINAQNSIFSMLDY